MQLLAKNFTASAAEAPQPSAQYIAIAGFAKAEDLAYFLRQICEIEYVHEPLLAPTDDILTAYKRDKGDCLRAEIPGSDGKPSDRITIASRYVSRGLSPVLRGYASPSSPKTRLRILEQEMEGHS
jgi:hypothetical protein